MAWLSLNYEHVAVDIHAGDTATPEYRAKNPARQIPLLELEDGRFLPESNAILYFLSQGTPFWPENTFEQAQALRWMFFEQYKHEPAIAVARYIRHYAMDTREGELVGLIPRGYAALDIMEGHLSGHAWFAGVSRSIADIALYAYTHVAGEGGFNLENYPNISEWLARVADHPNHILITDEPNF